MLDPKVTTIEYVLGGDKKSVSVFLPADHLVGVGIVMANWGLFEMLFDNFLEMVCWHKGASGSLHVPFWKRSRLLRTTIQAALPNCTALVDEVRVICKLAVKLGRKRNVIAHSHWFQQGGVVLAYGAVDMRKPRYLVLPEDLFEIAYQIGKLRDRLVVLQTSYIHPSTSALPNSEAMELGNLIEQHRPKAANPPAALARPQRFML